MFISPKKKNTLYAKSYTYKGKQLIALGNDYNRTMYVKLSVSDLPKGDYKLYDYSRRIVYQKEASYGFSERELSDGILIELPGKEWAALKVSAAGSDADDFTMLTRSDVQKKLALDTPKLKEFLAEIQ